MNEPAVQIRLQRLNGLVEGFPQGGLEELLFDRAVEAFDEAIGLPRPDLGAPLLDRVEREIELEEPAAAPGRVRPVQDGDRLGEVQLGLGLDPAGPSSSCKLKGSFPKTR